jgi:hypothetical protein
MWTDYPKDPSWALLVWFWDLPRPEAVGEAIGYLFGQ